jgi:hypothetical protein
MPTVGDLIEPLARHLDETMHHNRYGTLLRESKDVEAFLSFVSEEQPWTDATENADNHAVFVRSLEWLAEHLYRQQQHALAMTCPPWLSELVDRWSLDRTPVITLNYDLLVESTVDTVRIDKAHEQVTRKRPVYRNLYPEMLPLLSHRYQDGGMWFAQERIEAFPLLKLHGSLNWAYSSGASGDVRVFDTGAVDRWGASERSDWTDVRASMRDLSPLIVPPVATKSPLFASNGWMRSIWMDAARALNAAGRVFVLGYSLPASDIQVRNLLGPKVASKLLFPVNTDLGATAHFSSLLNACVDPSWVHETDPIRNFAQWYVAVSSG